MKKAADVAREADNGANASFTGTSTLTRRDVGQPSSASAPDSEATPSVENTRSHSEAPSHETPEKAGDRRGCHASPDHVASTDGEELQDEEDYSYSSYDDHDSYYDEEEEGSEALNNSRSYGRENGSSRSPGSPPPQEDLLRFLSFPLEDAALKDHRLMTIEAFRQVLLLGTNQGAVAVVDTATGKLKDLLFNHREPISDVDCTVNELYVASSDKAGYVSVQSRRDTRDVWISQLGIPIESVALHPIYHKMDSRPMVCGGGTKVLLLTKGMLWSNSRRVTTLQENCGRIHRVRWCQRAALDVVAWLSDQRLTLYDMKCEAVVHHVPLPGGMPQNALYPPTLQWEKTFAKVSSDDSVNEISSRSAVLVCGWGDIVQEIRLAPGTSGVNEGGVAAASNNSSSSSGLQALSTTTFLSAPFQRRAPVSEGSTAPSTTASSSPATAPSPVSVTASRAPYSIELRTSKPLRPSNTPFPYRVCGIAPYGPQRYVVLASIVDSKAEGVMKDLEVRVVERSSLTDVYRGRMPVCFIHPLQLRLTYLDPTLSQNAVANTESGSATLAPPLDPLAPSPLTQYFILSVDAIVKATPADVDDHVEFLLRTGQFEKAYAYATLHVRQLRRHVLQQVGHQWLLSLFEKRGVDSTAILRIIELLPQIVPDYNSLAWEQWIYRLDTCGESWRMVALLPGRDTESAMYNFGNPTAAASPSASPPPTAPTAIHVPIKREYYDLVLLRCLRHDANLFYAALHRFETLFTVSAVLKATEVAYREHCGSYAWWATEEEEDDNEEGEESAKTAVNGVFNKSPPTPPSAKQAKIEGPSKSSGTSTGAMDRTARWSLAASYGFLLRCAGRFEEAMQILMHLPSSPRSDRELFGLIRSEQLFRKTLQMLPELLQRRKDGTLELLIEHVAPPFQYDSLRRFTSEEATATASVSPPASRIASASLLDLSQYGSTEDPLNVEAVVDRLENSDRLHLLRYLDLVKELYPKRFVDVAKRHAQLVATLYIDYDRSSLLPFLKQMSMYVERIRELHALCHKNGFVEEEIFLLFRMGREEEALRILIEKMHDIHRALEFVVSIPDREEQAALFLRLVDYTVDYNASLPCRRKRHDDEDNENKEDGYDAAIASGGVRYVLHQTQPGETYASVAQSYRISVDDLLKANRAPSSCSHVGSAFPASKSSPRGVYPLPGDSKSSGFPLSRIPTPESAPQTRCIVPLNLLGSLLNALADPQFCDHPAVDVRHVLKRLPNDEPIPHAGMSIAAIAHTVAEETGFLSTVSEVGERDLMGYYSQLLKRRTAAIVMGKRASHSGYEEKSAAANTNSGNNNSMTAASSSAVPIVTESPFVPVVHRCVACHELITQQVVVFGCQHMYHIACMLQYAKESAHDVVVGEGGGPQAAQPTRHRDAGASRESPITSEKIEDTLRKMSAYCRVCRQQNGEQS